MLEFVLWIVAAFFALAGIALLVLWVVARNRPEWLRRPLEAMRRVPWMRRRIDRASAQALARDSDALLEELPTQARKALEKSFQGRSEAERAEMIGRIQELAEAGRVEEAAELLRQRPRDKRQKSRQVQKRRARNKAARRARKKR